MIPALPGTTEFTPIFNWSPPRSRKLSLISFIVASVALHALCFYIFQIIYPPTIALLPPPARVNLITADSEEGRSLLRWIEAEDPALTSLTQRPPNAAAFALPKPAHVPSYLTTQPALKEPPLAAPDLSVPSSRPPGPVPAPRAPAPAAPATVPTTVTFADEAGRLGTSLPKFTSTGKETPEAARFRLGIGPHGDVRYCFLQQSSGEPALDEQARRHLLLSRFPISEGDLRWTIATFEWGNDLVVPSPAP